MSKTKILLGEQQVEDLSRAIEEGVKIAVKEYTDAKVVEETQAIYDHLAEIFNAVNELTARVNDIVQHLADHLERHEPGATNGYTHTQPSPPDGSGNQQPSG